MGRIDILVECGNDLVVAVEVKVCAAEEADTEKQEGYRRALKKYAGRSVRRVLLVTDAEKDRCHGFEVRLWREVCLELRRAIGRIRERRGGLTAAAMVLAFAGAVEQNLLGFHRKGAPGMTAYLQEFIGQEA
jgi:hypothetical protein